MAHGSTGIGTGSLARGSTRIGPRDFVWGERTYVMGIVNATPDSFSGDGLLAAVPRSAEAEPTSRARIRGPHEAERLVVAVAVAGARQMVDEGADILDVGGESTRPGHLQISAEEELARVVPVIAAIRTALRLVPLSVDTTKASVARAALEAGADLINDVWGVASTTDLVELAAERHVPIVLMHNRAAPLYTDLMAEIAADLRGAIERALAAGVPENDVIIDPGFGFGKTPVQNLNLLRELSMLRELGRPILLGTSRKSTLGRVLDLPPGERLEATLATTALAIAGGVDIVRVHDVRENVRVARIADAVIRGTADERLSEPAP